MQTVVEVSEQNGVVIHDMFGKTMAIAPCFFPEDTCLKITALCVNKIYRVVEERGKEQQRYYISQSGVFLLSVTRGASVHIPSVGKLTVLEIVTNDPQSLILKISDVPETLTACSSKIYEGLFSF